MSTKKYFQTRNQASDYKKFRSEMPPDMMNKILECVSEQFSLRECVGVDVGCGSGQSSLPMAPYLSSIIGIDVSSAQLAEVQNDPRAKNVQFRTGKAEQIPIDKESVQLVIAMHAAHWFDLPKFLDEADRILVPGGILAIGDAERGFRIQGFEEEGQKLFQELRNCSSQYWQPEHIEKDTFYQQLTIPYKHYKKFIIPVVFTTSVSFFVGRIRTVSGVGKFLEEEPKKAEKVLQAYQDNVMKIIGATGTPDETEITYTKMYNLCVGRKT